MAAGAETGPLDVDLTNIPRNRHRQSLGYPIEFLETNSSLSFT